MCFLCDLSAQYGRHACHSAQLTAPKAYDAQAGCPSVRGCPPRKMPIDDRDDRRTPSNAPEELVMDLLAALQAADYAKAQPLIEKAI